MKSEELYPKLTNELIIKLEDKELHWAISDTAVHRLIDFIPSLYLHALKIVS